MNASPSIVTVTFNPALDQTVFLDGFVPGAVNRATGSHRQAGGKGVNVATMLAAGGADVTVTGFLGEEGAAAFEHHFNRHGLHDAFVRVPGEVRTGIKLVDAKSGQTTDINLPGPEPEPVHLDRLKARLMELARPGRWFVLGGSLPPGVPLAFISEVISALRNAGAKIAVDFSGPALSAAIAAGVDLAKPNVHELAELLGRDLGDFASQLSAARGLQREKVPDLVVSLGAEGALFLSSGHSLWAEAPPVKVVSTVGAGDALLAGYLQGLLRGDAPADRARLASVYAWSRLEYLVCALPPPDVMAGRLAQISIKTFAA